MTKKVLLYLGIVLGFLVLAYAFTPEVLSGKIVNQSDFISWRGMANEIIEHNEANPSDHALWTGSMFSGMPSNTIEVHYKGDLTEYIYDLLQFGSRPASYLFISLVGGFLLFLAFGVNIYLAILGAIAITLCSYNMQIIQVGHNTKMLAIAFMPWVLAGVVYAYRQKHILKIALAALLFALALSFQIKANHPQITYYLAIIIFGFAIAKFIDALKKKEFNTFFKTSLILLVAGVIGIAVNANHLLPTYEYAKYTMRGGAILESQDGQQTDGGLDLDYATSWSYGINETPNLLIPNFNGGSSIGEVKKGTKSHDILNETYNIKEDVQLPLYWGPQPFTAGPMYMGAISIFLFVLALCLLRGYIKWWVIGVGVLSLFLAWGSHFMWFSELFFNNVPLYNKFRTVSMILVNLQLLIPVLGILGLNKLIKAESKEKEQTQKYKKALIIAFAVTGGLSLIFALLPSLAGSFVGASDARMGIDAGVLASIRQNLLRVDALRSLIFILLAAAIIYFSIEKKVATKYALGLLCLLVLVDMWSVGKRYLNESHFIRMNDFHSYYKPRPVDEVILEDKDENYRVLDVTVDTFNDAIVSYHHKTIGGYSAAKLQRYQDLIDYYISPEIMKMSRELNTIIPNATTIDQIEDALGYYPILAMLNTRYIVIDPNNYPLSYDKALGNAWIVSNYELAKSPEEEITKLGEIDPMLTAILDDEQFRTFVSPTGHMPSGLAFDPNPRVELTSYSPNELKYKSTCLNGGIAVFSEIYYPAGWKAYINGEERNILRANYALRALQVPAGEAEIVFRYDPLSMKTGRLISIVSSAIILLGLSLCVVLLVLNRKRK